MRTHVKKGLSHLAVVLALLAIGQKALGQDFDKVKIETVLRDRIEQLVKEGKTLEEALQAKPTQGFYEDPASSFPPEGFVKVVYMELAEKQ